MSAITLTSGDATCAIHPELGGCIGRWTIGDQAMFRTASDDALANGTMLAMASFPLVPYSNRIGNASFEWAGVVQHLTPNFAPEPHAIHGIGWEREWRVDAKGASSLVLTLEHRADAAWPWHFTAQQFFVLTDRTLTITSRITNTDEWAVPAAFGHHPYFDANGATLTFAADRVWMAGADALPTEAVVPKGDFDFANGNPVEGRNVDHCFGGVTGTARIKWRDRALGLAISSTPQLPCAVVFVPRHGDAFCFEPVPHCNNALNRPGDEPAMPVLTPGESTDVTFMFEATE